MAFLHLLDCFWL